MSHSNKNTASAVAARMGQNYAAAADAMYASFVAREAMKAELEAMCRRLKSEREVALAMHELGLEGVRL